MSDQPSPTQPGDPGGSSFFQNFQHTPIGARVPEKIGRGVFATAMMVLQTNELFVLDFLSMGAQPQQIVSRIVMTATTFSQFLGALRHNVKHYEGELGALKPRYTPTHSPAQSRRQRRRPRRRCRRARAALQAKPPAQFDHAQHIRPSTQSTTRCTTGRPLRRRRPRRSRNYTSN